MVTMDGSMLMITALVGVGVVGIATVVMNDAPVELTKKRHLASYRRAAPGVRDHNAMEEARRQALVSPLDMGKEYRETEKLAQGAMQVVGELYAQAKSSTDVGAKKELVDKAMRLDKRFGVKDPQAPLRQASIVNKHLALGDLDAADADARKYGVRDHTNYGQKRDLGTRIDDARKDLTIKQFLEPLPSKDTIENAGLDEIDQAFDILFKKAPAPTHPFIKEYKDLYMLALKRYTKIIDILSKDVEYKEDLSPDVAQLKGAVKFYVDLLNFQAPDAAEASVIKEANDLIAIVGKDAKVNECDNFTVENASSEIVEVETSPKPAADVLTLFKKIQDLNPPVGRCKETYDKIAALPEWVRLNVIVDSINRVNYHYGFSVANFAMYMSVPKYFAFLADTTTANIPLVTFPEEPAAKTAAETEINAIVTSVTAEASKPFAARALYYRGQGMMESLQKLVAGTATVFTSAADVYLRERTDIEGAAAAEEHSDDKRMMPLMYAEYKRKLPWAEVTKEIDDGSAAFFKNMMYPVVAGQEIDNLRTMHANVFPRDDWSPFNLGEETAAAWNAAKNDNAAFLNFVNTTVFPGIVNPEKSFPGYCVREYLTMTEAVSANWTGKSEADRIAYIKSSPDAIKALYYPEMYFEGYDDLVFPPAIRDQVRELVAALRPVAPARGDGADCLAKHAALLAAPGDLPTPEAFSKRVLEEIGVKNLDTLARIKTVSELLPLLTLSAAPTDVELAIAAEAYSLVKRRDDIYEFFPEVDAATTAALSAWVDGISDVALNSADVTAIKNAWTRVLKVTKGAADLRGGARSTELAAVFWYAVNPTSAAAATALHDVVAGAGAAPIAVPVWLQVIVDAAPSDAAPIAASGGVAIATRAVGPAPAPAADTPGTWEHVVAKADDTEKITAMLEILDATTCYFDKIPDLTTMIKTKSSSVQAEIDQLEKFQNVPAQLDAIKALMTNRYLQTRSETVKAALKGTDFSALANYDTVLLRMNDPGSYIPGFDVARLALAATSVADRAALASLLSDHLIA